MQVASQGHTLPRDLARLVLRCLMARMREACCFQSLQVPLGQCEGIPQFSQQR